MDVQQAYAQWAGIYDNNRNRTRDLEAVALRETLAGLSVKNCIEIGCGTGKNSIWLAEMAESLTAVDLSPEMLDKARQKVQHPNVVLLQCNILETWPFEQHRFDLAVFSLVLEHIEDLRAVFRQLSGSLATGGKVYVGELHPFKQYAGSQARFETAEGTQLVPCFTHHISDFILAAEQAGLRLLQLKEYFDDEDRSQIPRLLLLLFEK
jgi:ubiquinone/menaquinone biosynthesis C-methylase UbiE